MSMHMAVRKASTTILLRNRGLRFGSKISISESKRKKKLEKNKTSSKQYQILINTSKSSLKQCTSKYSWYFHFLRIRHINRIVNRCQNFTMCIGNNQVCKTDLFEQQMVICGKSFLENIIHTELKRTKDKTK